MQTDNSYFDCFTTIGPRQQMVTGEFYTREHLLESMDRCGIDWALTATTLGAHYDPMWANRWLLEQVAPHSKRLFPIWTALPHQTGEFPEPGKFVALAQSAGVRAVRLYPKHQSYSMTPTTLGPLMKALAKARLPVFIQRDQFVGAKAEEADGFARLELFLKSYPANRIVALGLVWNDYRHIWPLLENHTNWLMEFSSFQANLAPETLVKRFGPGRFLFGSDAPVKSPGAARAFFDWTGLTQAQVKQVTHGNLCDLLGIRCPPATAKKPADDIVAAEWAGQPLNHVEVLDAHAHVNHAGCNGVGGYTQLQSGPSEMKRLFHSIGIRRTAASAWLGIFPPEPRLGNDITADALRAEPGFMIGYACMDPVQMTQAEIGAEIRLRYEKQGFLGLKPYINTTCAFDDPRYDIWYRYANRRRLFALFHGSAEAAARVAAKYPGLQVILAHSGASIATAEINSTVALTHPNIVCELTLTPVANGAIELLVKKLGAKRVLFGTDAPMRDPRPQLGWAVHAAITREDKVEVLGGAFAGILKRCRPVKAQK
jgi:predicted TIM-barrel fold metal-dependent hydrolase